MSTPAWIEVENLFRKYGLPSPPVRLRDELAVLVLTARAANEVLATTPPASTSSGDGGEDAIDAEWIGRHVPEDLEATAAGLREHAYFLTSKATLIRAALTANPTGEEG